MAAKAKSNKSLGVGSSMNPGLSNKNNIGLVLRPSPVQNTYLQISKEPNTDLDLSVSMAREQLEQIRREGIAQTYLAVTEIDGRPITVEAAFSTSIDSNSHKDLGETSIPLPLIGNSKGNEPKVVTVAVGNLDSDKHSVEEATDFGKKGKIKRTYNLNKHSKTLHGSNTRFKNSGSQKVSLKTSMEQLAENIAIFSKENLDFGAFTKADNNLGGVSNPEQ
ncbi:hypothetical protein PVK06_013769 [Gossypium arboreum]|uniref:Uncharacterized protein n=1 Tax=Gossypium arboreum TaxID=29729 RepID=A0ABR0PSK2_GOSAR|nr:hypothetical protein PVK06_013769 [Gossypium arboreum]